MSETIADLLLSCEERGLTEPYGPQEVRVSSRGAEVFVVSDLHLAAGKRYDGRYTGCENFFYDSSFHRFLGHAADSLKSGRAILVINGDFVDFLRVAETPERQEQFTRWRQMLESIGIRHGEDELEASVSVERKQGYGLKTHDFKSVWKLALVIEGHKRFFDALADWLARGHRVIIVKGNHDLEWYWRAVRNYLRLALAERISESGATDVARALTDTVLPNLTFADQSVVIDDEFYIEHGHRYDPYSRVWGDPTLKDGLELNIPFGSFFNRYLLNVVEIKYPYLDNVRPRENLLPVLVRERFPLALKVIFHHIPFMLKLIPKKHFRYIFRRAIWFLIALLVPAALVVFTQWDAITALLSGPRAGEQASTPVKFFIDQGLGVLKNFGWLALSYVIARFVAYFQLVEPSSLSKHARDVMAKESDYRLVTFGHTHNPDQFEQNSRWFYNTGTWIPIVELSNAEIRNDKTYTFLHMTRGEEAGRMAGALRRWNDEANRAEDLVIISRD